jgi:hypothetical protein
VLTCGTDKVGNCRICILPRSRGARGFESTVAAKLLIIDILNLLCLLWMRSYFLETACD